MRTSGGTGYVYTAPIDLRQQYFLTSHSHVGKKTNITDTSQSNTIKATTDRVRNNGRD